VRECGNKKGRVKFKKSEKERERESAKVREGVKIRQSERESEI
jgi:hypothetical protein